MVLDAIVSRTRPPWRRQAGEVRSNGKLCPPFSFVLYLNSGCILFQKIEQNEIGAMYQNVVSDSASVEAISSGTRISMYHLSTQTQQKFLEIVSIQSVPCP